MIKQIKEEKNLKLDVDAVIVKLESVIPSIAAIEQAKIEETKAITLTSLEKQNLSSVCKDRKIKICVINVLMTIPKQLDIMK